MIPRDPHHQLVTSNRWDSAFRFASQPPRLQRVEDSPVRRCSWDDLLSRFGPTKSSDEVNCPRLPGFTGGALNDN